MDRDQEFWIEMYRKKDALWIHNGNPLQPHALLTSGNHSDGFFNSRRVIVDIEGLELGAKDLLSKFSALGNNLAKVEVVVGPQTGATMLASLLAGEVVRQTETMCCYLSPSKHEEEGKKSMVFTEHERKSLKGKTVLLCEDVLTTGGSVKLTAEAVEEAEGIVLPFTLALVNRSGATHLNGYKIIALIDRHMPAWTPEECPLCKEGSEAIRPKDNWARLNATN